MIPSMNRKNVFVQNRFSIRALARIKELSLADASEYWAKENSVSDTADKLQWMAMLKHYEKKGLVDQLFE